MGATKGCWGSGAVTAVATGTAASPRIMVSWNLVSSSCFVVGNGISSACLYRIAIVFICATVHSAGVGLAFWLHKPCLQAPCAHLFSDSLAHSSALLPHASSFLAGHRPLQDPTSTCLQRHEDRLCIVYSLQSPLMVLFLFVGGQVHPDLFLF